MFLCFEAIGLAFHQSSYWYLHTATNSLFFYLEWMVSVLEWLKIEGRKAFFFAQCLACSKRVSNVTTWQNQIKCLKLLNFNHLCYRGCFSKYFFYSIVFSGCSEFIMSTKQIAFQRVINKRPRWLSLAKEEESTWSSQHCSAVRQSPCWGEKNF